jgi:von Willebrand factor type A domain/Dockerin type I domain
MRGLIRSAFFMIATAMLLLGASSRTAKADEHVLVLLDTTGSMTLGSSGGLTRLEVGKARIASFLDTVPSVTSKYSLWFFEGSTYTRIFSFADNKTAAEVKARVLTATTGGLTPLAHSVCAAVDELINYLPSEFHSKRVYMATDGEENNSPVTDQCYGPSSTTLYPTLTIGSWQWKVRNKACTGDASIPGLCAGGVPPGGFTLIIDVDHLFDFVPLMSASTSAVLEGAGRSRGTLATAAAAPPANADAAFFGGLAKETKGRYAGITPATPLAQATPQPGDVNLDGCVNINDRALVLQQYGTPGTSADLNRDGIVNIFDLQTVLRNFGRGCVK